MDSHQNPWLPRRGLRPDAKIRLFCIPHAGGGGAVYHRWAGEFPGEIDVLPILLPGRERRIAEPALNDLRELVAALADALAALTQGSFALFGHSMGALTAFELCREFRRRSLNLPVCLLVAAYRAPQLESRPEPIHHLGDEEFVRTLQERFQGIPQEIAQNPELLKLFLPALLD
jgi:surfactin synthase thioesterase subunit